MTKWSRVTVDKEGRVRSASLGVSVVGGLYRIGSTAAPGVYLLGPADALVIVKDQDGMWPEVKCATCQGSGVTPEHHEPWATEMLSCRDCRGTGTIDREWVAFLLDALAAAQEANDG